MPFKLIQPRKHFAIIQSFRTLSNRLEQQRLRGKKTKLVQEDGYQTAGTYDIGTKLTVRTWGQCLEQEIALVRETKST